MTADLHLDTGVLAVGAMPSDEAAAAWAHVESCEACRVELAGFIETVALLGGAAAEVPPASLRRSVMAAIAVTPQLPPVPSHRAVDRPTDVTDVTGGDETAGPGAAPPASSGVVPDEPADAGQPGGPRGPGAEPGGEGDELAPVVPLRRWYRRPVALLAAAAAAAILAAGTVIAVNQFTGEDTLSALQECIERAPDAELLQPEDGAGDVTYSASCAGVLVDVSGLPVLPDDRTYQLWMLPDEANPRSLSLLPAVADGGAQVVVAPTAPGDAAVGITDEPAAGSTQPTSAPIWVTTLDA